MSRKTTVVGLGALIALAVCLPKIANARGANTVAHPPANAKRGPSKADPFLKQAREAFKKGDRKGYDAAILAAKKILAEEGRYSCCVTGGCDECALEGNCGCGENLFAKKGVCKTCLAKIKAGLSRYEGIEKDMLFEEPMGGMMLGTLGPWPMNREGSGTTWLPDSSPMFGRMRQRGDWQLMEMGLAFAVVGDAGGTRGESQVFGATQYMLMGQKRDSAGGVVGARGMFSLDPLTNGKKGYPNLFQTGETANGRPLKDRQHPHDLVMELAATASAPLGNNTRGFVYLAPVGEPAIGPAAFLHRPSAWDNPSAPISHHWLDGTHITYGVATAGVTLGDRWKLEGSAFNGSEPNEERYGIDRIRINSYSGRVSYNPGPNLSFQASYGFLKSPETLEPGVNQHRLTLSMMVNKPLSNGDNVAAMLAFGQNRKGDSGETTGALLAEAAYIRGRQTYFARIDSTQKSELVDVPTGKYTIRKFSIGAIHNLKQDAGSEQGVGASLDFYSFPATLKPAYGNAPVSVNVFYRLRFGRM